jgi:putative endonuclease
MGGAAVRLGPWGEQLAVEELERRGYRIVATNYRTRRGEIDIVAWHGRTLVFVEVKTRRSVRFGSPASAVTWQKQRRLRQLASMWLACSRAQADGCRFDVVSIEVDRDYRLGGIEVFKHAF